ncbi:glycine cleavage system H protein [Verticillium alfalfae VaMs.102]|uniref:Glycine cleavage system H protein n=1 Tax=Verticillium alfalfae (strain VaMs.102 / ATCC MYA-4576 / FGSC 10136) TaxID=526221 RepID=C9SNQ1_VERA1|nr:glycine cleavage system H protein [Verticillium alfalfae VaMs.102]EEY20416.1 glycine cleavage system H protein [Verticillium alfalfae VaMs.102]
MASIARCVRAARPSVLSAVVKPAARPVMARPAQRTFATTPAALIRKYTKDHEWIDLAADNKTGVIGISDCKVVQVNIDLEEKPGTINKVPEDDSHGGGWLARVEVDEQGVKDLESLMDAEAYKAFVGGEH